MSSMQAPESGRQAFPRRQAVGRSSSLRDPGYDYVLIADDDGSWRDLLKLIVGRAGYRGEVFDRASSALRRIALSPPQFLITDYLMPEMDGIALIRALRAEHRFEDIPVILYTGMVHDPELQERLRDMPGVVHVISKQNVGELLRAIARLAPNTSPSDSPPRPR
jgi:CheY-like chemotaxis protein